MAEGVGWVVIIAYVLGAMGLLDVTIRIEPKAEGVKTICVRGADHSGQ